METYELRYFLTAAELQSVNKAADRLAVSAPAISKAIRRLEEELGVPLFERVGRNVVLSLYGKQLQKEVSRIIGDLDDLKSKFKPTEYHLGISLIGTEFGLSAFASEIIQTLDSRKIQYSMNLKMGPSSKHIERSVLDGEAHLGIITRPPSSGLKKVKMGEYHSKVYVGSGHPLFKDAKKKQAVPIEEVLRCEFASFLETVFSEAEKINQSVDGWRDDKFRRKIAVKSESIETVLKLVERGKYLCYLPTPLTKGREVLPLQITGCPYQCVTEVFLIASNVSEFSWMSSLFE